MKRQSLYLRFKRYMEDDHWNKSRIGYLFGLISGTFTGFSLMILYLQLYFS